MYKMEWQKKAFFVFIAAVAYRIIPMYIQNYGALEDVFNHQPGPCSYLDGIDNGSEDMAMLPDGTIFITSGLERFYNASKGIRGRVYLYNLKKANSIPTELRLDGIDVDTFTPHGIDVWQDKPTGRVILFVVNHKPQYDTIEQFEYQEKAKSLVHLHSFVDQKLTQANNLAATGPDSFYFTNYLFNTRPILKTFEMYMPMTWGSVYHWAKDSKPQLVVNKLKQPNGIVLSPDTKYVYLAHEGNQELIVYHRLQDNSLKQAAVLALNTTADNLSISPDGRTLWLATHAVFWKIKRQMTDPEYPAPSQILRVRLAADRERLETVTEIFADDGSTLKGSSSAVFYKGRLLIGTIIHKTMVCELRSQQYKS